MRRPIEIGTKEIYNYFKKETKSGENKQYRVDYKLYKKILEKFGENWILNTINKREGTDFPNNRGYFVILKRKMDALPKEIKGKLIRIPYFAKDWEGIRQEGKKIQTYNDHSDGYKFKWTWKKGHSLLKHKGLISLEIERRWDIYLGKSIKGGKQDYFDRRERPI